MSDLSDYLRNGGVPRYRDLPDYWQGLITNIKNTWQDAENLDDTHGYTSYIWIPEETYSVVVLKLAVFTEKFRAYSKATLSGGGTTVTSAAGGEHSHTVFEWQSDTAGGFPTRRYQAYQTPPDITIDVDLATEGPYPISTDITKDHTHDVNIPDHTHDIDFGIYEEDISGRTLSAALYDPDGNLLHDFGTILEGEGSTTLDLTSYFSPLKYGFYRLELSASGRMRVRLVYYELCRMYID